jgi:hypothetical protein
MMTLGHISMEMLYIWAIAIVVLGAVLAYGIKKSGRLSRREREHLDENTRLAQRRDDPQKRSF